MKFKFIYLLLMMPFVFLKAQVLYSDDFSTLSLQNDVQVIGSKTISTTYTTASAYTLIDDGFKNNIGTANSPNRPINVASLRTIGWAVLYNSIENLELDLALLPTSYWLRPGHRLGLVLTLGDADHFTPLEGADEIEVLAGASWLDVPVER